MGEINMQFKVKNFHYQTNENNHEYAMPTATKLYHNGKILIYNTGLKNSQIVDVDILNPDGEIITTIKNMSVSDLPGSDVLVEENDQEKYIKIKNGQIKNIGKIERDIHLMKIQIDKVLEPFESYLMEYNENNKTYFLDLSSPYEPEITHKDRIKYLNNRRLIQQKLAALTALNIDDNKELAKYINTTKNKMQTIDQNEYLIDAEKGYIPSSKNQYYAQDFHYTKQDGKNALYTGEMDIKQNFLDESIYHIDLIDENGDKTSIIINNEELKFSGAIIRNGQLFNIDYNKLDGDGLPSFEVNSVINSQANDDDDNLLNVNASDAEDLSDDVMGENSDTSIDSETQSSDELTESGNLDKNQSESQSNDKGKNSSLDKSNMETSSDADLLNISTSDAEGLNDVVIGGNPDISIEEENSSVEVEATESGGIAKEKDESQFNDEGKSSSVEATESEDIAKENDENQSNDKGKNSPQNNSDMKSSDDSIISEHTVENIEQSTPDAQNTETANPEKIVKIDLSHVPEFIRQVNNYNKSDAIKQLNAELQQIEKAIGHLEKYLSLKEENNQVMSRLDSDFINNLETTLDNLQVKTESIKKQFRENQNLISDIKDNFACFAHYFKNDLDKNELIIDGKTSTGTEAFKKFNSLFRMLNNAEAEAITKTIDVIENFPLTDIKERITTLSKKKVDNVIANVENEKITLKKSELKEDGKFTNHSSENVAYTQTNKTITLTKDQAEKSSFITYSEMLYQGYHQHGAKKTIPITVGSTKALLCLIAAAKALGIEIDKLKFQTIDGNGKMTPIPPETIKKYADEMSSYTREDKSTQLRELNINLNDSKITTVKELYQHVKTHAMENELSIHRNLTSELKTKRSKSQKARAGSDEMLKGIIETSQKLNEEDGASALKTLKDKASLASKHQIDIKKNTP